MRREQLPVRAQLPKPGGDEQRYVRPAVVAAVVQLRAVAARPNVVGELQAHFLLDFVCAEVGVLGVHAGRGLRLQIILLDGEADGVFVLRPPLLGGECVMSVVRGESHFAEADFARAAAHVVGQVFAGNRNAGRLHVGGF